MAANPAILHQRWGIYAYGRCNWPDAVSNLRRAVELDPTLSEAWYFLGLTHHSQNRLEEAMEDFSKAIDQNQSIACLRRRGYARAEVGDYTGALEDFGAVLNMDAADVDTLHMSALVRIELGDLSDAIDDLSHAIERTGPGQDVSELYDCRARVYSLLGDSVSSMRDQLEVR